MAKQFGHDDYEGKFQFKVKFCSDCGGDKPHRRTRDYDHALWTCEHLFTAPAPEAA